LYSSEGCSSCPPADAWLANQRNDAGLWKRFVPIAFQVDYWNYLGWEDPLSRDTFTARQRAYGKEFGRGIYTPEFIRDGVEQGSHITGAAGNGGRVGSLEVRREGTGYVVTFEPAVAGEHWIAHVALLANGVESKIKRGENGGRTLRHEFAAIALGDGVMKKKGAGFTANVMLPASQGETGTRSLAAWVSRPSSLEPVQAVGGDLPR
jgi:hypothetical protein